VILLCAMAYLPCVAFSTWQSDPLTEPQIHKWMSPWHIKSSSQEFKPNSWPSLIQWITFTVLKQSCMRSSLPCFFHTIYSIQLYLQIHSENEVRTLSDTIHKH
jgi:hypothetical protein